MGKVLREHIDDCISQCTAFLSSSSRHIKGEYGWHQHLGTNKIGIVATAMVLLYYKRIGMVCPAYAEAINFIKSKAKAESNNCTGWPYISNTHGQSNVESTCWALLALHEYEADECAELIDQGVNWILSQYQNLTYSDNGWGFTMDSKPRIYITAFVLRTLTILGKTTSEEYESANKWLIRSQNDDGGWGELPEKGSSIFYTSYVLVALLDCGLTVSDKIIRNAKRWLDNRLANMPNTDPALLCYMEFIESGTAENRTRITFFHYVPSFVLLAYCKIDHRLPQAYKALQTCINNCDEGVIEHPLLENSRIVPVWAIYDTVMALQTWKESYTNWDKEYQFSILFKKIRSFRRHNPLRFLPSNLNWVWKGSILLGIIWTILHFSDSITSWLKSTTYSGWGQILISFVASAIYGLLACFVGWLLSKSKHRY